MFRVNAWNRPAALTIGAWKPPARRASSTSRGGTSASASTSRLVRTPRPEDPALHDQVRVGAGEVAQRLGRGDRVAAVRRTKAIATGPSRLGDEVVEAGVVGGPAGERVLEDLVVGGGGAQRGPQARRCR